MNLKDISAKKNEDTFEIPRTIFIKDIEDFMKLDQNKENVELVLTRLDEEYGAYKFMEMNLSRKKKFIKEQLPDIHASIEMIKLLQSKKLKEENTDVHFMISDDSFVKAVIPPTNKITLCLGANMMLEYELHDAENLLKNNFKSLNCYFKQLEKDLHLLQDQLITVEVNMARVYNWGVRCHDKKMTLDDH